VDSGYFRVFQDNRPLFFLSSPACRGPIVGTVAVVTAGQTVEIMSSELGVRRQSGSGDGAFWNLRAP